MANPIVSSLTPEQKLECVHKYFRLYESTIAAREEYGRAINALELDTENGREVWKRYWQQRARIRRVSKRILALTAPAGGE